MNRRESLGRNRKVASPLRTNGFLVLGLAAMLGGAWYAWTFFSAPERVYGAKKLDCPPTQVTFESKGSITLISGCGKTREAICDEKTCGPVEE